MSLCSVSFPHIYRSRICIYTGLFHTKLHNRYTYIGLFHTNISRSLLTCSIPYLQVNALQLMLSHELKKVTRSSLFVRSLFYKYMGLLYIGPLDIYMYMSLSYIYLGLFWHISVSSGQRAAANAVARRKSIHHVSLSGLFSTSTWVCNT